MDETKVTKLFFNRKALSNIVFFVLLFVWLHFTDDNGLLSNFLVALLGTAIVAFFQWTLGPDSKSDK